jgi:hypothetical protein
MKGREGQRHWWYVLGLPWQTRVQASHVSRQPELDWTSASIMIAFIEIQRDCLCYTLEAAYTDGIRYRLLLLSHHKIRLHVSP